MDVDGARGLRGCSGSGRWQACEGVRGIVRWMEEDGWWWDMNHGVQTFNDVSNINYLSAVRSYILEVGVNGRLR